MCLSIYEKDDNVNDEVEELVRLEISSSLSNRYCALCPIHKEFGNEVAMKEHAHLYQSAELAIDYEFSLMESLHFLLDK